MPLFFEIMIYRYLLILVLFNLFDQIVIILKILIKFIQILKMIIIIASILILILKNIKYRNQL